MIKATSEIVEKDFIVYKTGITNCTIDQICKNYRVSKEALLHSNKKDRKLTDVESLLLLKEILIPYRGNTIIQKSYDKEEREDRAKRLNKEMTDGIVTMMFKDVMHLM